MVPSAEPLNTNILVIDNDPAIHNFFKSTFHTNSTKFDFSSISEIHNNSGKIKYNLEYCETITDGFRLTTDAEISGHPFAIAFIGENVLSETNVKDVLDEFWRTCPDLEVLIGLSANSRSNHLSYVKDIGSDQLIFTSKPPGKVKIMRLVLSLTGKWSFKNSVRASIDSIYNEQARKLKELERSNKRLQQELILQRKKQESLTIDQNRYRAIFEKTSTAVVVHRSSEYNSFGKIVEVNDRFCELCGYSPGELVDRDFSSLLKFNENTAPNISKADNHLHTVARIKTRSFDMISIELKSQITSVSGEKFVITSARVLKEASLQVSQ